MNYSCVFHTDAFIIYQSSCIHLLLNYYPIPCLSAIHRLYPANTHYSHTTIITCPGPQQIFHHYSTHRHHSEKGKVQIDMASITLTTHTSNWYQGLYRSLGWNIPRVSGYREALGGIVLLLHLTLYLYRSISLVSICRVIR